MAILPFLYNFFTSKKNLPIIRSFPIYICKVWAKNQKILKPLELIKMGELQRPLPDCIERWEATARTTFSDCTFTTYKCLWISTPLGQANRRRNILGKANGSRAFWDKPIGAETFWGKPMGAETLSTAAVSQCFPLTKFRGSEIHSIWTMHVRLCNHNWLKTPVVFANNKWANVWPTTGSKVTAKL